VSITSLQAGTAQPTLPLRSRRRSVVCHQCTNTVGDACPVSCGCCVTDWAESRNKPLCCTTSRCIIRSDAWGGGFSWQISTGMSPSLPLCPLLWSDPWVFPGWEGNGASSWWGVWATLLPSARSALPPPKPHLP